ncbi:MAG: EAL domain-containing protein [Wenzhouxiangellaceae bacterium]
MSAEGRLVIKPEQDHSSGIPAIRILAVQTQQLFAALPGVLLLTSVAALMLYVIHRPVQDPGLLSAWLAAFLLQVLLRLWMYRAYKSEYPIDEAAVKWYERYRWATVLSALIWGAGAWVFFIEDAPFQQALLAFFVAGLGAGGIVNLAARWQCAWWFLPLALLPYAWRFWEVDQPLSDAIAAFIVLFTAVLMTLSRQISRRAVGNIVSSIEQQQLADRSARERERFESLIESTSAIIWEGVPGSFAFSYISPEAEKLLGYPVRDWLEIEDFWLSRVHPEDRDRVARECLRATEHGEDHVIDYRMIAADGRTVWLRDVAKLVYEQGRPARVVGVMFDISEIKHVQHHLEYASGLQNLMVDASRRFLRGGNRDFDHQLSNTLAEVGQWCDVDRAYLIRFSRDLETYTATHEWVADSIRPERENIIEVPSTTIPELIPRLKRKERVAIDSVESMRPQWHVEQKLFRGQGIRALLVLPIFRAGQLIALIGFDSCREEREWSEGETAVLQLLADLIGAALEHSETEQRLRASEALRMHAEALAEMGSWEWEEGSEEFQASPEWRKVLGCGAGRLTAEQVLALTPEDERGRVQEALSRALKTGEAYDIEHRIVRPDNGQQRWVKVHAELATDATGARRLRGFAQDITARKQAEDRLTEMAHYDSLTSLPNRILAMDRLEQALKRAARNRARVALLFLDLDHFKKVNDTLGHDVGDQVLADAAGRLARLVRVQDTVARIGGDEFVIIVEDFERDSAVSVLAGKVLEAFRTPLVVGRHEFLLTASVGIAVAPEDGETARDLMRNADTAMYHAKSAGRDAFEFFARKMNQRIIRQMQMEQALRGVVARDELKVVYQSLVRLSDGVWIGAEALLRWQHPQLGDVPPSEFIGVAEQTGLIGELGEFVIDAAVARCADWQREQGRELRVSVNISPRQFRDSDIAHRLLDTCRRHGLPVTSLEVEITEGVLLSGRPEVLQALEILHEQGVGIVMDDFGTGFASLSYLRDYPFTALKIDRTFVAGLESSSRDRKLVISAIQLGRALGMGVVAEGVETEAQRRILLAEGCEFGQGFLFGEPIDPETFSERLTSQKTTP